MKKESEKEFSMLKLNKSSIIELNDSEMSTVTAGEAILSIGSTCSCNNSCDRDNINPVCCACDLQACAD